MKRQYGIMIQSLREGAGISQKTLARGILSVAELSRIEAGEKEVDKPLLAALLQRMGKSIDKLVVVLSHEEYRKIVLRALITKSVREENGEMLKKMIEIYEEDYNNNPLERQYIFIMKATLNLIESETIDECCEILENALRETEIELRTLDFDTVYLCTQEIQIILLHEYVRKDNHIEILLKLKKYLELRYTDEEEKVRVYPQCLWKIAQIYLKEKHYQKAYDECEKAIDCLTRNGVITILHEFLNLKINCLEKLEKREEIQLIKKQIDALNFLFIETGYILASKKELYCIRINEQSEVIVSNELIRTLRIAKNLSQEELCEDICARETLSRIEKGNRSPNKKKLRKLLEKMDFEGGEYLGIDTCNYEVLEKIRDFKKAGLGNCMEEALSILGEIEQELDCNTLSNRQFLESSRLTLSLIEKGADYIHIFEKLSKILCYTMKEYNGTVYRIPFKEELELLIGIAICLKNLNHLEEAKKLLKSIAFQYDESGVLDAHHSRASVLLYFNLSSIFELSNEFTEAEEIGKKALQIETRCDRGDYSGMVLANLSCIYERREQKGDREKCQNYLKNSYYLQKLFQREKQADFLKKYFYNKFKKEIV